MKIERILCPIDFSEYSQQTLTYAALLASSFGANLYVLNVFENLHGGDRYLVLHLTPEEIAQKMKSDAEDMLKSLTGKIQATIAVEAFVREGKAFVEIIRLAREKEVDLIVMGSHGRTGLPRLLIGSVAEKVTRKAPCPVLIVKDKGSKFEMP